MNKTRKPDIVDRLVSWGCNLLHLGKYEAELQQLAKFVIVGVTNTAINWVISFALYLIPNFSPLWANTIAFAISTIFNFWASTTWVFDTTKKKTRRQLFLEFVVFNLISFFTFDIGLYALLYDGFGWGKVFTKIFTTFWCMLFNFVTRKCFLEDHDRKKRKSQK